MQAHLRLPGGLVPVRSRKAPMGSSRREQHGNGPRLARLKVQDNHIHFRIAGQGGIRGIGTAALNVAAKVLIAKM